MPELWTLHLRPADPAWSRSVTPVQLHGLATSLLEGPGADHTAAAKPFAVSPLLPAPRLPAAPPSAVLRIGWLDDDHRPDLRKLTGEHIRLGHQRFTVLDIDARHAPYAEIAATPPAPRVTLRFVAPTFFSRSGRWLPLPDPVMTYSGLARRWNAFAPDALRLDDEHLRPLLDAVAVSAHDTATHPVDLGNGHRVGFTGTATFTLVGSHTPHRDTLFAALTRYATHAGVGAHTTHGLGHVELEDTS